MSSSVLCGRSRLVLPQTAGRQAWTSLRVARSRTFSAASSDEPYLAVSPADSGPRTVWPDESMGPFGPQDQRFQLPGNVGFDCHLEGMGNQKKVPVHRTVPDVLTTPSSTERHQFTLAQFVNEFHGKLGPLSTRVHKADQYFNQTETDCSISSCPELLRKELELLFPSAPTASITVVTVTQRTSRRDDGAAEPDQDQLLHKFVSGAKEMCFALWTAGYWADFIDPTTGEAVNIPRRNSARFKTTITRQLERFQITFYNNVDYSVAPSLRKQQKQFPLKYHTANKMFSFHAGVNLYFLCCHSPKHYSVKQGNNNLIPYGFWKA
ncbi:metabolism of cobalamin associated Da isoform X1 [Girardinichthys multiradiatus]|uniref:metabolism of cobalamin associated Da isoform X1 n=1 Tax=Girardinichthys multiradiatus TaxID=208333 RepID=UPI001FABF332|nr:metabolism of cobalamin associated Da isoform X1 [Girardinichthys multiradiatus]XP_047211797.1 metabolism of cobalamin associated Da isoform X1 [Girardinichthys multiradiatus]XP_047211798.1 metabolism of cobalamin associated Da isoform X1 [Girardinichthys multiradiatus]